MNRLLLVTVVGLLMVPSAAQAQRRVYHVGGTVSWGDRVGLESCGLCSPNRQPKHLPTSPLGFVTAGVSWVKQQTRWVSLQAGGLLTLKGWPENGSPSAQTAFWYAEFPMLVGIGRETGPALVGGIAVDLGIPKGAGSDASFVLGPEIRGALSTGARWGLGLRYTRGFRHLDGQHQGRSYMLLFGFSPALKPK